MPSPTPTPVALLRDGHIAGLDGLRAIAVGLVLVYHLFPGLLRGGFIGVDVFFVLSGFLITTLLLREHAKTGRVALGSFWRRRARRLLPAIALVVLTCGALAAIVGGDTLVGIGRQVLGSLTFSYNWLSIASDSSYFDQTAPELFRNFWSLAVEEQFYIAWPLLFIACMVVGGRAMTRERAGRVDGRLVLGAASIVIGIGSLLWMLVLYPGAGDATRVYFGTDTHAFGLAMGSALACALFHAPVLTRARARASVTVLGITSVAALVLLAAIIDDYQSWTYPWGLLLASAASVGVILAVMLWPRLGELLDAKPLRWVGMRSYGIYLWHWPFVVLAAETLRDSLATPLIGILVLGITLVVAQISYRWIEQPFRRYGFRVIGRHTKLSWVGASRSRSRAMLLTAYGLVTAVLLGTGILSDPGVTQSARGISDGQDRLSTQEPNEPSPSPSPTVDAIDVTTMPEGSEISAIGDSVMLASVAALQETMPGIDIDASVSRGFANGVSIAEDLRDKGELREYVVIGLATNGTVPEEALDRLSTIAQDHKLVLVTAFGDRPWIPPSNDALHTFVNEHPGVTAIADWSVAAEHGSGLLAPDLIHPEPAGATVYAAEVVGALERLQMLELGLKPHRLPDTVRDEQDEHTDSRPKNESDDGDSDADEPGAPEENDDSNDEPNGSGDPRAP